MAGRSLLIVDACVLIDFWNADPTAISEVVRHVGDVHIAANVLAEVRQVDHSAAVSAGLIVVEPSLEVMTAAANRRRGLSFQDKVCLVLAKERGWACVSNDGRLRAACGEDGVAVVWGLELLAQVVEAGALPVAAGVELAERMAAANRFLTQAVVAGFVARVSEAE